MLLSKNHTLEWQKRLKKRDPMQLFAEKGDFSNKKRPKRDPKSGLGLLRDPGLPKRDPVGSSAYRSLLPGGRGSSEAPYLVRSQALAGDKLED